uniref:Beta-lactamase-related domain-containing protein n=1 Tax=Candidatus Kentrum sp. DK TaxID=2126562 RepID=A0A450RXY7_9GAMM|nr:MAG: hypothetical protein BECKDK2373C_GA0170839_100711 [Candidatus Kentron sp. DK]
MQPRKIFTALLIVTVVALSLKFFPLGQRLYLLATLDDPDKIVWNLQHMEEVAEYRVIPGSGAPYRLPKANRRLALPETFPGFDGMLNTREFLDETQSTGFLILHEGKIIYEEYARGLTEGTTHALFSVTKSVVSALVGAAISDGYLTDEHEPVVKYLPELAGTGYDGVTIAHCLEMASGVRFLERHDGAPSDMKRFKRRFALGFPTMDFLKTIEPDREPGSYNAYNSLDAQVVGMVVDAAIGERTLSDYLHEKIWRPVGMRDDARWLIDGAGVELSLGGLLVTLRDMAKFGQLYLQKGQWNGKQIIPADWVERSVRSDAPHLMPGRDNPLSDRMWGYKYLWWTPEVPSGGDYFASGLYNQHIYVHPQKHLVIAKTSANHHFSEDRDRWKEDYIRLFQAIAGEIDG